MPTLSDLSNRGAVLSSIREFDDRGRDAFLKRYGFGRAKRWYVLYEGEQYDSKAIAGVAFKFEFGKALGAHDFKSGEATVVQRLRALGFAVVPDEINDETSSLPEEVSEKFAEGMRTAVLVDRAERSARARRKCIEHHGCACAACGMEFETVYGSEFTGLIHVHHLRPLSKVKDVSEIDPKTDLVPVCPNCHAAIHYRMKHGKVRTLTTVRSSLAASGQQALVRKNS